MKNKVFILHGMADEPLADLGGRTPLDCAKTPTLDRLALSGRIGTATFVPRGLEVEPWVALFSILGYDPQEFYTGPGPLEALGAGMDLNDREVVFLCDFVSQLDHALVDPQAGQISDREAKTLLKDIEKKIHDKRVRFKAVHGFRNLMLVDDAELGDALDETPTLSPWRLMGENLEKRKLQGKAADFLYSVSESAAELLENHEINRVRVDLNENPANRVWLWGQGRSPKLPPLSGRTGMQAALSASWVFARGLARATGIRAEKTHEAIQDAALQFHFCEMNAMHSTEPLKVKIRSIEKFDELVAKELKGSEINDRVLVVSDLVHSVSAGRMLAEPVPFLMAGPGIAAENKDKFTEKNCALSAKIYEKGHRLLEDFLK